MQETVSQVSSFSKMFSLLIWYPRSQLNCHTSKIPKYRQVWIIYVVIISGYWTGSVDITGLAWNICIWWMSCYSFNTDQICVLIIHKWTEAECTAVTMYIFNIIQCCVLIIHKWTGPECTATTMYLPSRLGSLSPCRWNVFSWSCSDGRAKIISVSWLYSWDFRDFLYSLGFSEHSFCMAGNWSKSSELNYKKTSFNSSRFNLNFFYLLYILVYKSEFGELENLQREE